MSNLIFPQLRGISAEMTKTPKHNTLIQSSQNGSEVRAMLMAYPHYTFSLKINFLLDQTIINSDLRTLMGFYNRVHGCFDNFLVLDKKNCTAQNQKFGVGDGINTQYRLAYEYGGFLEPLYGVDVDNITIYINGIKTINYTVTRDAMVTFTSPPPVGSIISWSGIYYFRCRFSEDYVDFSRVMSDVWSCSEVKLFTVKEGG